MRTLDESIAYLWIGCDYIRLEPTIAVMVMTWAMILLLGLIGLGFAILKARA